MHLRDEQILTASVCIQGGQDQGHLHSHCQVTQSWRREAVWGKGGALG